MRQSHAPRAPRAPYALRLPREPRSTRVARLLLVVFVVANLPFAVLSGWRAYVQVRRLELRAPDRVLRPGSVVRAEVLTSGRVFVDVQLALVRAGRADTLGIRRVSKNHHAAFDFRARPATLRVRLTGEQLRAFGAGPAVLRATARGRPQWRREPPPEVRELAVEVAP